MGFLKFLNKLSTVCLLLMFLSSCSASTEPTKTSNDTPKSPGGGYRPHGHPRH